MQRRPQYCAWNCKWGVPAHSSRHSACPAPCLPSGNTDRQETHRSQPVAVLDGQLVDERGDHAAWPAPGRPEIYHHWHGALEHQLLKGSVVHRSSCEAHTRSLRLLVPSQHLQLSTGAISGGNACLRCARTWVSGGHLRAQVPALHNSAPCAPRRWQAGRSTLRRGLPEGRAGGARPRRRRVGRPQARGPREGSKACHPSNPCRSHCRTLCLAQCTKFVKGRGLISSL